MKAETGDYLAKARTTLADAQQIAALPLSHVAAREAYYAATANQLKATADYGIGPAVAPISADQAAAAITTAGRFIDIITQLLSPGLTPSLGTNAQA